MAIGTSFKADTDTFKMGPDPNSALNMLLEQGFGAEQHLFLPRLLRNTDFQMDLFELLQQKPNYRCLNYFLSGETRYPKRVYPNIKGNKLYTHH